MLSVTSCAGVRVLKAQKKALEEPVAEAKAAVQKAVAKPGAAVKAEVKKATNKFELKQAEVKTAVQKPVAQVRAHGAGQSPAVWFVPLPYETNTLAHTDCL